MTFKKSSFVFLLILFIVLVFIIGVRYGQRVEKTNKTIDVLLSIPPSPTREPTPRPLEFSSFISKICGVEFLYPNGLEVEESSQSASFNEKNETLIKINCEKQNDIAKILEDETVATAEIMFKAKKIQAKSLDKDQMYALRFINPRNAKTIFILVKKPLYPLFEKSLEFLP